MATCDEFPEFFFPDGNDEFPWDKPGWSDDGLKHNYKLNESDVVCFNNLQEAKEYAMKHSGATFIRNPKGPGFVLKSATPKKNSNSNSGRLKTKVETKQEENIQYGRPKNAGAPWRDEALAKLIKLHNQQMNFQEISKELERSPLAIAAKLSHLGLISEEEFQQLLKC